MIFDLDRPATATPSSTKKTESRAAEPSSTGIELAIAEASRYADLGEEEAAEIAYLRADRLLGNERSPRHAEVMVCLAMLLRRRGENALAVSYLDVALAFFPEHRAALSQRLALAREQGDFATAAALRSRMVGFCESTEAQAHVFREIVDDSVAAATTALRSAVALRPSEVDWRTELQTLLELSGESQSALGDSNTSALVLRARGLEQQGQTLDALALLAQAVRHSPRNVVAYRAMARIASSTNERERAFFASSALVQLGQANDVEQSEYRRSVTAFAPGAQRALDEAMLALLRIGEHPVRLLLLAIHDAAVAAKLGLRRSGSLPPIWDDHERQDPASTSIAAVKRIDFVTKLLGLPPYTFYARPNEPAALIHPRVGSPVLVIGSGLLRGASPHETLFRAGYELGIQRELGRIPVFFSTAEELEGLVEVALSFGSSEPSVPAGLTEERLALRHALDACLTGPTRQQLLAMVHAAREQRLSLDVRALLRDVELVSARLGLLACADVTVACRQLAVECRSVAGLSFADRVEDLLSFSVSPAHLEVRHHLGIPLAATSKSIPPFG
jgi:tetratricopeptide (TPR) repeat protein